MSLDDVHNNNNVIARIVGMARLGGFLLDTSIQL